MGSGDGGGGDMEIAATSWTVVMTDPHVTYLDTWITGYLDTWIPGYMDTWVHGYMDTWIHGYIIIILVVFTLVIYISDHMFSLRECVCT